MLTVKCPKCGGNTFTNKYAVITLECDQYKYDFECEKCGQRVIVYVRRDK